MLCCAQARPTYSLQGCKRAHARRRAYWAQRYHHETTAPADLFDSKGGKPTTEESRAVPALPASLSRPPADSYGHRDRVDSKGSGPHTLDAIAKTGKTTLGTAPQAKTGRSQGFVTSPAGCTPSSFCSDPNLLLVWVAALVLAVALLPSLSPKPKAGKSLTLPRSPNSRSFSWPKPKKLARAATPPRTALLPLFRCFPKPSPCPPLPKSPLPAHVAASLGPRSHGGGAQEGQRKKDRKGRK